MIQRSGRHLLALINDVLEMSKIEAGRIELNPRPMDLYALLDDLEGMFRVPADARRLQWDVTKAEGLPRHIVADGGKLRQILTNLLSNAFKFTESGGVVLRAQSVVREDDQLRLIFEVQDTGVGIASAEFGWLFDPFRQTASGIEKGGTGLGLAISRRHARLMEGDIAVTSATGQGSTFRLELPSREAAGSSIEKAESRRRILGLAPGQGEVRVLVVDDKADNRLYLTRLLEPLGFSLRHAANGYEAIALWRAWQPHLIIMDIVMPGMDGSEATRRIRASPGGRDVMIIALSASAFDEDRGIVMATGVDDFLRKPVTAEDLLMVIGLHLRIAYRYAEDDESARPLQETPERPLGPDLIKDIPADQLEAMRRAVFRSDDLGMTDLIRQLSPDQRQLASGLRRLVTNFDWEALDALLLR